MANASHNAGIDYFGLGTATSNALKVTDSTENRSIQTASGANSYGDIKVVDAYGETATPSANYDVVADVDDSTFADIGGSLISAADGFDKPLVVGGLSFSTSSNTNPTMSCSGTMVQTGATRLRKYSPVCFKISPRHRAQNCICTKVGTTYTPIIEVKKGANAASEIDDFGWESVSGDIMPIEITTCLPKGVLASYDLHGGTATINYTLNWYAQNGSTLTPPTIALTSAAVAAGFILSAPVAKNCPKDGYVQYTFSASLPMTGAEYVAPGE